MRPARCLGCDRVMATAYALFCNPCSTTRQPTSNDRDRKRAQRATPGVRR